MGRILVECLFAGAVCLVAAVVWSVAGGREPSRPVDPRPAASAPPTPTTPPTTAGPAPEPRPRTDARPEKVAPTMAGLREHKLTHQGIDRRYVTYTPAGRDAAGPLPVVLAFHGGMGWAEALMVQTRFNAAADRHGFLVVYPDGTGRTKLLTFNAGTCCGLAARSGVDDVDFVRTILDELPDRYPVDPRRVYATGLSNGAMLCYRLACEMPGRIAAIAPVAGGMTVEGPRPSRPVPVVHIHGMLDRNVPYLGGIGPNALQTVFHKPIPEVIAWWAEADHCPPQPAEVRKERDYVLTRYEPAAGRPGAPVLLYALPGGGHNWPGGIDTTAHMGTGPLIRSFDATELIWRFFERFSLEDPPAPTRGQPGLKTPDGP